MPTLVVLRLLFSLSGIDPNAATTSGTTFVLISHFSSSCKMFVISTFSSSYSLTSLSPGIAQTIWHLLFFLAVISKSNLLASILHCYPMELYSGHFQAHSSEYDHTISLLLKPTFSRQVPVNHSSHIVMHYLLLSIIFIVIIMRAAEIWEHFVKFSTSNHKSGEKAKSSNPHPTLYCTKLWTYIQRLYA